MLIVALVPDGALVVLRAPSAHSNDVPLRAGARLSDMKSLRPACSLLVPLRAVGALRGTSGRRASDARLSIVRPLTAAKSPRASPRHSSSTSEDLPALDGHRQQRRRARALAAPFNVDEQGRARASSHAPASSASTAVLCRRAERPGPPLGMRCAATSSAHVELCIFPGTKEGLPVLQRRRRTPARTVDDE